MSQVLIPRRGAEDREISQRKNNHSFLCISSAISAWNTLAGLRWNLARHRRRGDEREQAHGAAPETGQLAESSRREEMGLQYYKAVMLRGSTGRFSSAESWPAKYIRRDNKLSRPFVSAGRFSCRDCMNSPIMPMKPPIEAHIS